MNPVIKTGAAAQRAQAVLDRLPDGPVRGAEIGVFDGRMSAYLLNRPDLSLVMVDPWRAPTDRYRATRDPKARLSADEYLAARSDAYRNTAFAMTRRRILRHTSLAAATMIEHPLDFVFIDGEHSYAAVSEDIAAWVPHLKRGGLLCGHDYGDPLFSGVRAAVDRAVDMFGWEMETGADKTWFVRP